MDKRKVIKVTEIKTYTYIPDLDDDAYECPENADGSDMDPITTIEGALEYDKQDVTRGRVTVDEIAGLPDKVEYVWEITEEEDDATS